MTTRKWSAPFGAAALACAVVFGPSAAGATERERGASAPCEATGGPDSCTPIILCVEGVDGGAPVVGVGRAIGRANGVFITRLSNGAACGGEWRFRGGEGALVANCDDGGRLSVRIDGRSASLDVAMSYGVLLRGDGLQRVVGWSGDLVEREGAEHWVPAKAWKICGADRLQQPR